MAAPVLFKANVDDVMKIAKEMAEMVEPSLKEMSDKERNDIEKIMRKRISDEIQLTDSLGDVSKLSAEVLAVKMKELLSEDDYKMISGYVDQETFTMEIGRSEVTILRGHKPFRNANKLDTVDDITDSYALQILSLIAECIFLVLGVIGFKVAVDEYLMNRIIDEVMPFVRQPAFQRRVGEFLVAWGRGDAPGKAEAIFNLLWESNALGILTKFLKLNFQEMSLYDKAITIASIVAMIAAAFATGGVALIAKLALLVTDVHNLTKKIKNLTRLRELNAALKK